MLTSGTRAIKVRKRCGLGTVTVRYGSVQCVNFLLTPTVHVPLPCTCRLFFGNGFLKYVHVHYVLGMHERILICKNTCIVVGVTDCLIVSTFRLPQPALGTQNVLLTH